MVGKDNPNLPVTCDGEDDASQFSSSKEGSEYDPPLM